MVFDEATHTYRVNDVIVPSVTQVLGPLTDYSMIPKDSLERARQEGNAIHKMVDLDVKGHLDVAALPDWLQPRYEAWLKFCSATGFAPRRSEERRYSNRLGVAGTPDLDGTCRGLGFKTGRLILIDVKRSFYAGRVIGLQTAGYQYLIEEEEPTVRVVERAALMLNADGTFKYETSANADSKLFSPLDRTVFLAAVAMWKWRNK
ncbi:MAG: hypothetical protein ACRD0K_17805 [Egibacteraceae bacterium]